MAKLVLGNTHVGSGLISTCFQGFWVNLCSIYPRIYQMPTSDRWVDDLWLSCSIVLKIGATLHFFSHPSFLQDLWKVLSDKSIKKFFHDPWIFEFIQTKYVLIDYLAANIHPQLPLVEHMFSFQRRLSQNTSCLILLFLCYLLAPGGLH